MLENLQNWFQIVIDWIASWPFVRIAIIVFFAAVAACTPADKPRRVRMMTFVVGVGTAAVFTGAVAEYLELSEVVSNGVAGGLALCGRNLTMYVWRASKNPLQTFREIMDVFRGRNG